MNNERRKAIEKVQEELQQLYSKLDDLRSDEQDAFDNLPESLQNGDRGEQMQAAIDAIENAMSQIDEARNELDTAIE